MIRPTALRISLIAAVIATPAAAQSAGSDDAVKLRPAHRVSRTAEIAWAKSAAPRVVADHADIWVLGERGYEKAVEGTNGFGCIVQRGLNGQSMIPRCDDSSGVDALFPGYFLLEEMRAQGKTVGEYHRAVADARGNGRLRAPRHGGFSYMYSVDAFFVGADGQRSAFTPHVMIYWPNCEARDLGVADPAQLRETHLSLLGRGTPECHLIINTPPETARRVATGG